ncbi:aspartate aminotransferase family protein [Amycolatopsis rubida]|uniref:Aspartate aminotransferase family protein n=1 Tax=Amycolatopsis rubida TaxID=112413 RepID=A0ABX0BK29_9PSEU|nr:MULTISPECIES: aspartate aminotransferase family protein [Amycolatopsis]MYW90894.1 aminotransferase class III-fold pyridoxal phosphate-dependent enzyme [Amycolatopsis rubida]NEC55879.1 aspartate aminotransferase family protein [Amycolatopsis rubida]OAP26040.1 Acetylornithine/acetyl-lysine aminotransferase [Amycolatopsis sp. M39]
MTRPEMVNGFTGEHLSAQPQHIRELIARRANVLGPGYQLFYTNPVEVSRGSGVHLYDPAGNEYLDAYNNVVSLGHCHPAVVEAVTRQLSTLTTNTRYLQADLLDFSERLLATFPAELDRVTYTCTGSEANDLALRIARAHTGNTGIIVTRNAYHGVTAEVAAFSPSLGPTSPLGPHVRTISAPDPLRHDNVTDLLRNEIRAVIEDLQRHGFGVCALVVDSIFSSDGVQPFPTDLLGVLAAEVRAAGGVYLADEVQAGFGRTGAGWWGFGRHAVVPDLVTLGKPMGNGIPVAAAVLRHEIGREFGQKVRYFNTFGGSNVPIAAASAVLGAIEGEGLIDNAREIGAHLLRGFTEIVESNSCLAEVRGTGLFLGIEVTAPESTEPDRGIAQSLVDDLRENFVLVSASGPHGNVVKIRPPLVFSAADAALLLDRFADAAARVLSRRRA